MYGTNGLYIISIEKPFFNGDILEEAFANASTATFSTLRTKTILKSLK